MGKLPVVRDGLNHMQLAFAEEYVRNGGNGTQAASFAGYAAPGQRAHELLMHPGISSEIRRQEEKLLRSGATIALHKILYLIQHAESEKVALDAAKTWLDRSGRPAMSATEVIRRGEDGKPIHQQNLDELEATVLRLREERAQKARIIDGDAQVVDVEILGPDSEWRGPPEGSDEAE